MASNSNKCAQIIIIKENNYKQKGAIQKSNGILKIVMITMKYLQMNQISALNKL